jgi:hypothetical protein
MSKTSGYQKRKHLLAKYGPDHPTLVKERARAARRRQQPDAKARQTELQKKAYHDPKNVEKRRAHKEANRTLLNDLKSKGCVDCGYKDLRALDFDHLPGQRKLGNMSDLHKESQATLLAEIAKCEVVCANCHRIRTIERQRAGGLHTPLSSP